LQWRLVIDVDSPKQGQAALEAFPDPGPSSALHHAITKTKTSALTSPSFVAERAQLAGQAALIREQDAELSELKRRVERLEMQRAAAKGGTKGAA
jgi:hypothetical protein